MPSNQIKHAHTNRTRKFDVSFLNETRDQEFHRETEKRPKKKVMWFLDYFIKKVTFYSEFFIKQPNMN